MALFLTQRTTRPFRELTMSGLYPTFQQNVQPTAPHLDCSNKWIEDYTELCNEVHEKVTELATHMEIVKRHAEQGKILEERTLTLEHNVKEAEKRKEKLEAERFKNKAEKRGMLKGCALAVLLMLLLMLFAALGFFGQGSHFRAFQCW